MSKNKNKNNPTENTDPLLSQSTVIGTYGIPKKILDRYLPKPTVRYNPRRHYSYGRYWKKSEVEAALQLPEVQAAIAQRRASQQESRDHREISALLMKYNPDSLIEKARALKRVFVLHVGPTNSGKTYDAVNALKSSRCGTYLGPLRLLALEMFDKINASGVPCSLLTGEESIPVEGAGIVASTIELCDFRRHYKVAVIDEAQLVTDSDRGSAWLKAMCLVDAEEVHICLAPEALSYIESLVRQFGDPYSVVRHERLVPLVYAGKLNSFDEIQPHDAVICFSRKNVLSTAAHLERSGIRASVIYGALPPAARRSEVQKYTSGETSVIVATDAIGMGISLPIRRVIFSEVQKFDGKTQRPLTGGEIRQIAGRAGRYGMFDLGEVLTMDDSDIVENGLRFTVSQIRTPCIAFPREVLATDYPLDTLLRTWQRLPGSKSFKREDVSDALVLYSMLRSSCEGKDRELIYDLITCPVDTGLQELLIYWLTCARAILRSRRIPEPHFDTDTLQGCELQYKAYDVHHQLLQRIGQPDSCSEQREEVCRRIAELMAEDKSQYIRRCKSCGKELPLGYTFNLCPACYSGSSMHFHV